MYIRKTGGEVILVENGQIAVEQALTTTGQPSMMAEMAQAIAHKLKGMGGSFGYPEITNIAVEIESLARDQRSDALPTRYDS